MKEKSKKQGGKRKGAGRKPSGANKESVTVYTDVSRFGGKEGARVAIYSFLDGKINLTGEKSFVPLDYKEADLKFFPPKTKKMPKKPIADGLDNFVNLSEKANEEIYDAPPLPKSVGDEFPKTAPVKPRNLDELKALCPFPERTQERSDWVRIERQKYRI